MCGTAVICRLLQLDGVSQRPSCRRPPRDSGIAREWLEREYVVKLRSIETLSCERGVTAPYLMSLAKNWGLPVRHHSQFSGIGHLDLPALLSPTMRAVTLRKGALRRLELITQIPCYASIAAAARAFYDGRESALVQRVQKIEAAAAFTIIDRSTTPLTPTPAGHEFLREAFEVLRGRPGARSRSGQPGRSRCEAAMTTVFRRSRHAARMAAQWIRRRLAVWILAAGAAHTCGSGCEQVGVLVICDLV